MTEQQETILELFKMFLNLDGFGNVPQYSGYQLLEALTARILQELSKVPDAKTMYSMRLWLLTILLIASMV